MDPNRTHHHLTHGMNSLSKKFYRVPRSDSSTFHRKRGYIPTTSDHLSVRSISRMKSLDMGSRGKLILSQQWKLADDRFAGDANDDFIVEIQPKTRGRRDRQARHRLKTLRSEFRLRHALSGCYLFSHKVKLPEWGFEQQEVSCPQRCIVDAS
jgi:dolichyl-phosphate-mannose--protein O-mannosyl transferase